ncbi:Chemotaxis protein CheV [Planctomycetes bacterium Pan216]|uniref:Chemotaxis protein CheV n=1 Tax=Kolteria novifilia TaxID=2527975 RepID=A0A518BDF8_9BACT|nr:Chemotaxis protein CheV [Planctomycetes bacterium Pan216]
MTTIAKPPTTQSHLGTNILLEAGTNELEVLVFHLDEHRYGINGAKVREVVHPPKVRPVPNAHESLDGLCKLRDLVMPMVSLRKYFQLNAPEQLAKLDTSKSLDSHDSQVIVTVFNSQSVAFRVDRVDRIYRISWEKMRPLPELCDSDRNLFTGLTVIDEDIVLMVDLEKISEEINGRKSRLVAEAEASHAKPLLGKRILYAEDSLMIQTMTTDLLRAAGVDDLHIFNNGQDAWNWVNQHSGVPPLDVVVTDIEMPLMDGLHLTSRLRQDKRTSNIPVILLSSLINAENEKKGKAVGATAQLVKSKINLLPGTIAEALTAGK